MPKAETLTSEDGRFIGLFVGKKSSGKTCAACSFIGKNKESGRTKVLDFDGRIRGILGAPWLAEHKKRIDYEYYPPRVGPGAKASYVKINDDLESLLAMCNMGQNPYDTLICDSLTSDAFAMLCDAIPLTHADKAGKKIGVLNMAGPSDYGFEATNIYNQLSFFRSLPIQNIIVTAHLVERYGKLDPDNAYSESIVVGEKLSLRDKIAVNSMIYFDHIFRFDRRMVGKQEKFFAEFRGDIATTSFAELPTGEFDITGKNFYEGMLRLIQTGKSSNDAVVVK